MDTLKYPIGRFDFEKPIANSEIKKLVQDIEMLPADLKLTVSGFNDSQFDTAYRPGGWTVRQVIHHLADSHLNAYIRFNLALTEEAPTIKPYKENLWAELAYKKQQSLPDSLMLLELIHKNWVLLLNNMSSSDFNRTYIHPEYGRVYTLLQALGSYAWHGKHHLAHISGLIDRDFDN